MLKALGDCGVDNIAQYKAEIRENSTGNVYSNYKAVNVIGVISIIKESKSNSVDLGIGSAGFYHSLVLDESLSSNLLLFRPREVISNIVVHRRVRDYLLKEGFSDLDFIHPSDFAG